jgi:peptidoglycan/LPS O-acetylase OafA/YrhL
MVAIQHSVDQMHRHAISGIVAVFLFGGSAWGSGVDIFFVIGGFIMLYITTGLSTDQRSPLRFFQMPSTSGGEPIS